MPHLVLEYSNNLAPKAEVSQLLRTLHEAVGHTESVAIETLKSRLTEFDTYFIGSNTARRAFLYVRLGVLPGRSAQWKTDLGGRLFSLAKEKANGWSPKEINCSVNVEIYELVGDFYMRTPPP